MATKKANRGEWSELLALAVIARDASIAMSDAKLRPISGQLIHVDKILREDRQFHISGGNSVEWLDDRGETHKLSKPKLEKLILSFTQDILSAKGAAFASKPGNEIVDCFGLKSIKAGSTKKEDIELAIRDPKTQNQVKSGFSIKSYLGNPNTLLNASKDNTNFKFRVDGFSGSINQINGLNDKSKVRSRIEAISACGGKFSFVSAKGPVLARNLTKIDSLMPAILGYLTLANFIVVARGKRLSDVISSPTFGALAANLPVGLDPELVAYKIKSLLLDIALGMVPTKDWDGRQRADGGYIVVKETGDLVCFHVYNFGEFSDYLFANTMFDTPSTARHGFGNLYEEGGELFFDVNCQIRFVK